MQNNLDSFCRDKGDKLLQSSAKYQEDIVHLAPEESDRDALHEMQSSIEKLGMIGDQKIVQ